jgi:hypothetical protein
VTNPAYFVRHLASPATTNRNDLKLCMLLGYDKMYLVSYILGDLTHTSWSRTDLFPMEAFLLFCGDLRSVK